jgi:E-phenylitaconyl-CoA hydratase
MGLETDKPLICAVNGYALAGGTELLAITDIAIASENAKFGLSEVKRGSIPWGGSIPRLARSLSKTDFMLLLLTGDTIDAQEALRMGLVSKVVPHADLMPTAMDIARRIAHNAPLSVRAAKQLFTRGADMPLTQALALDKFMYGLLKDTEDRVEGRKAFAEKRNPVWKGR